MAGLLYILLLTSIFLPPFNWNGINFRLDDILLLTIFPLLLLYKNKLKIPKYSILSYLIIFFISISLVNGFIWFGYMPSKRDIFELVRLTKPLILILFVFNFSENINFVSKTRQVFIVGSCFLILIAVFQYTNFYELSSHLGSLYSTPRHTEIMIGSNKRIVGIGSDPNVGAAIFLIFGIYLLSVALIERKQLCAILSFGLFLSAIFTGSRTGFICIVAMFGAALVHFRRVNILKIFAGATFLVSLVFGYFNSQYIYKGFSKLISSGTLGSLSSRLEIWQQNLGQLILSPFLGRGSAKAYFSTISDGEVFSLLARYGILGSTVILAFLFYPTFLAFRANLNVLRPQFGSFVLCNRYISILLISYLITNSVFLGYQLMVPIVILGSVGVWGLKNS